jgi:AraC family transcriptional regulator, transcriptional activator of pobA
VLGKKREGPPVYTFEAVPGAPPVNVLRLLGRKRPLGLPPAGPPTASYAHSHDFLVLAYVERGGGSLRLGEGVAGRGGGRVRDLPRRGGGGGRGGWL